MKHTFWRDLRGENKRQRARERDQLVTSTREESKNATIYRRLFMQRLICYTLSEWAAESWPANRRKQI